MKILYIGGFFPKKLYDKLIKDKRVGLSNHNFEMSLINGFTQHNEVDFKCVTSPKVYSFPHNSNLAYIKSELFSINNKEIYSIGFCNILVLNKIWKAVSLICKLITLLNKFKGEKVNIIVNTPDYFVLNSIAIACKFSRKYITKTIIIPDIPQMITTMDNQKKIKGILLKYLNKVTMKKVSNSDGLVLLTKEMMDFIDKPIKHIVMEGIIDEKIIYSDFSNHAYSKRIVLYTGTIRRIFGILSLLQAFIKLDLEDVELWICGSGDTEEEIKNACEIDKRIKFWGLVDSKTALKMQHNATILVNPRTSEGEYTKYSFPSKTMEYLLAGKSIIMNKLPGIPNEYFKYVYTPKDETIESLTECMYEVLSMPEKERSDRALAGKNFVLSQKNSIVQTTRILKMIESYK